MKTLLLPRRSQSVTLLLAFGLLTSILVLKKLSWNYRVSVRSSKKEWILLTVEKKPFVSVVWLGTILLMIGFSFSIMRRWSDQKRRELREKKGEDQLE